MTNSIVFADSNVSSESSFKKTLTSIYESFSWDQRINTEPAVSERLIDSIEVRNSYQSTQYPIVLCHGISRYDRQKTQILPSLSTLFNYATGRSFISNEEPEVQFKRENIPLDYWCGIQDALEAEGSTVLVAKVPGFGSIEDRASELNKFITSSVNKLNTQSSKKMKINLIAHSMGGLDCRWLISEMEKQNYEVVSLTTITTPHRGSEVADYVVNFANSLSDSIELPQSFYQLTTSYLKQFNEVVKDDPNVLYFSYGASFVPKWYNSFFPTWSIINGIGGANDGMVSVESSKWGTYLGTLNDLDHLDLINRTSSLRNYSRIINNKDGIDSIALYLDIAHNLSNRGL